ncbi:MAG: hypothetical protein AB8F78_05510 [Saprospiraceae bacterium]
MLISCNKIFPTPAGPANIGWVPEYEDSDSLKVFRVGENRDAQYERLFFYDPVDSSQFVELDSFRYRLDTLRGVAVLASFRGSDFFSIERYFKVPGIRYIKLKNDSLIVNNMSDELTLSTINTPDLSIISRQENAALPFIFPETKPDPSSLNLSNSERYSYFQCLDSTRGVLLGWRLETFANFECYVF